MKHIIYLLLLTLGALASVEAKGDFEEITPTQQVGSGLNFKVIAKPLTDGTTNFKITISRSSGEFYPKFEGSLAVYKFTQKNTDRGYIISAGAVGPIQILDPRKDVHSFTYDFSVSKELLEKTDFSFIFTESDGKMPSFSTYYLRLKKFVTQ